MGTSGYEISELTDVQRLAPLLILPLRYTTESAELLR